MRKLMIAGNWKMNKSPSEAVVLAENFDQKMIKDLRVEVVIAPTLLSLPVVVQKLKNNNSNIRVYAQNCYFKDEGAYTGEVSAKMLKSERVDGVIIGHSERRQIFNESNFLVNEKVKAAINVGLQVILCVGETLIEREEHHVESVIAEQLLEGLAGINDLSSLVIAYEPVWAIGTGKTATPDQAEEVHQFIRKFISDRFNGEMADKCRILYGGSVKASNANELLAKPNIDGALIGGASLKEEEFLSIIDIASRL